MPKWFIYLSLAFMAYVISANPAHTGNLANGFLGAGTDLVSNAGEFLGGVFGEGGDAADGTDGTPPDQAVENDDAVAGNAP